MSRDRQPPKALEIYAELRAPQRSNPQIYVHFSPCTFGHNLLPCLEIISKCRPFVHFCSHGEEAVTSARRLFWQLGPRPLLLPHRPGARHARAGLCSRPLTSGSGCSRVVLFPGRRGGDVASAGAEARGACLGAASGAHGGGVSAQNGELGPLGSQKGCSSRTLLPGSSRLLGGSCS